MKRPSSRFSKRCLSVLIVASLGIAALSSLARAAESAKKIPVVLSTDIGDDIDDTWALGFLLKSPELDLKLAIGDYGRPEYRAKLLARFLERTGHADVPVGLGVNVGKPGGDLRQGEWVKDYDLGSYPGVVHRDGVQAMINLIMTSPEPITVIAIGPAPNIAAALEREPRIAERARFVGMHGSVRLGYGGSKTPAAEWNVKADPKSCQKVFTAPWPMTITPLDTCGIINLAGEKYRKVRDSKDPVAVAILENYRLWLAHANNGKGDTKPADSRSSTLFDTVAVYLAFDQSRCNMETLGIRVTDDGFTKIDSDAKKVSAATSWKNLGAFEDLLVNRVSGGK